MESPKSGKHHGQHISETSLLLSPCSISVAGPNLVSQRCGHQGRGQIETGSKLVADGDDPGVFA